MMMIITCPNPNCESNGVKVVDGIIESHSPGFQKTYSPRSECPLSNTKYGDWPEVISKPTSPAAESLPDLPDGYKGTKDGERIHYPF